MPQQQQPEQTAAAAARRQPQVPVSHGTEAGTELPHGAGRNQRQSFRNHSLVLLFDCGLVQYHCAAYRLGERSAAALSSVFLLFRKVLTTVIRVILKVACFPEN